MLIGQRLRDIREAKDLSQRDIANATGFVPPYISRVEHGHSVPQVETLEKWARALGMTLYQLMYDGEKPPEPLKPLAKGHSALWGDSGPQASELSNLRQSLAKMDEADRKLSLALAGQMAYRSRSK